MQKRKVKLIFSAVLTWANKQLQRYFGQAPLQTCDNCIQAIRIQRRHDLVVCLPHLKIMPANNSLVCDSYLRNDQKR